MANKDDIIQIVENRTRVVLGSGTSLAGLEDMLQTSLDLEINSAIRDYSMDEPRVILEDKVPGDLTDVDGVQFFLLDKWDDEVSDPAEVEIEFPVDKATKEVLIQGYDRDFTVQERPTGAGNARQRWVKFWNPPAGMPGTWRIRYKTKWDDLIVSAALGSLTLRATEMVGLLTSVYVARGIAGKFGKTTEPTLDADAIDYRSRSAEWRALAAELFKEYENRIDRPARVKRAGQDIDVVDHDLNVGGRNRRGRNYLVHRRSRR
jgi:hypothetical protein